MNLLFGNKWKIIIVPAHSDLLNKIGGQSGKYEWNWDKDTDEMLIRKPGKDHISIPAKIEVLKKLLSGESIDFQSSGLNRSQSKKIKEVLARRGTGWVKRLTKDNLDQLSGGLSGIYAIYDDADGLIYTGRAKGTPNSCIKARLNSHFTGKDGQQIGKYLSSNPTKNFWFSYEIMDDYDDVREAEAAEILRLNTSDNKKPAEEKWLRDF